MLALLWGPSTSCRLRLVGFGVALAVYLAGCGGSDSSSGAVGCPSFSPCGGNLVGSWQSPSVCTTQSLEKTMGALMPPECSSAYRSVTLSVSGSLTFKADSTVEEQSSLSLNTQMAFTAACIGAMAGSTVTAAQASDFCDAYGDEALGGAATSSSMKVTAATCTMASDVCSCNLAFDVSAKDSGNYAVSGSTVTVGKSDPQSYCVQGDTVVFRDTNPTMGELFMSYRRSG